MNNLDIATSNVFKKISAILPPTHSPHQEVAILNLSESEYHKTTQEKLVESLHLKYKETAVAAYTKVVLIPSMTFAVPTLLNTPVLIGISGEDEKIESLAKTGMQIFIVAFCVNVGQKSSEFLYTTQNGTVVPAFYMWIKQHNRELIGDGPLSKENSKTKKKLEQKIKEVLEGQKFLFF